MVDLGKERIFKSTYLIAKSILSIYRYRYFQQAYIKNVFSVRHFGGTMPGTKSRTINNLQPYP